MILKKCRMNATMMKITIRGIIIKAQGSTQNLIFQNFKEECMSMTSWIGLIRLKASLSIVKITPPPPEHIKVNLVAKMSKNASFWGENIKRQCKRDGKKRFETWEKMKKELKRNYLPFNYRQDIYLKIQNF